MKTYENLVKIQDFPETTPKSSTRWHKSNKRARKFLAKMTITLKINSTKIPRDVFRCLICVNESEKCFAKVGKPAGCLEISLEKFMGYFLRAY